MATTKHKTYNATSLLVSFIKHMHEQQAWSSRDLSLGLETSRLNFESLGLGL